MRVKGLLLFVFSICLLIAASSINVTQSSNQLYSRFEQFYAAGEKSKALTGYRYLAQKLPYTAAGWKSMQKVIASGEPFWAVAGEAVILAVERTTMPEWLILTTAFLVMTVFIWCNFLPIIVLVPFALTGAGLFHLSHPVLSINHSALSTFLEINPYIYGALTLLIMAGYAKQRWALIGKGTLNSISGSGALSLAEELAIKEINISKLLILKKQLVEFEKTLKSPAGKHCVKDLERIFSSAQREFQNKQQEIDSKINGYHREIAEAEATIEKSTEELRENHLLLKNKVINRGEFKSKKAEEEARINLSRQMMSEAQQQMAHLQKVGHLRKLNFSRQDVFAGFMDAEFRVGAAVELPAAPNSNLPAEARKLVNRREELSRKSVRLAEKLSNLEKTREKVSERKYKDKHEGLTVEKEGVDHELRNLDNQIEMQRNEALRQVEHLTEVIEVLSAELTDMKLLKKVKGCFPGHVRQRLRALPQEIKACTTNQRIYLQAEKVYGSITPR